MLNASGCADAVDASAVRSAAVKLYIDLDGVLSDWEYMVREVLRLYGVTAQNYRLAPYSRRYYKAIWQYQAGRVSAPGASALLRNAPGFWSDAPLMPNAVELLEALERLRLSGELEGDWTVLSAVSADDEMQQAYRQVEQKRAWIRKHLGEEHAARALFPKGSAAKKHYAVSGASTVSLLIDDQVSVINAWNDAGGIGILHTADTWKLTVSHLKQALAGRLDGSALRSSAR